MRCANPKCNAVMLETVGGTMRLLELELPPEARTERSEWGFPILCVPTRYFWLCAECSRLYQIHQWTPEGLLLQPRMTEVPRQELVRAVPRRLPVASQRVRHGAEITRIA